MTLLPYTSPCPPLSKWLTGNDDYPALFVYHREALSSASVLLLFTFTVRARFLKLLRL